MMDVPVAVVSFAAASREGARWADLQRRRADWRMVWAGALSISFFLCLGSVYTFALLYGNPNHKTSTRDLWLFQVVVWLMMVVMAVLCVVAERRISGAEEEMARMLTDDESSLSWDVPQPLWNRFKAIERARINTSVAFLLPLMAGLLVVAFISAASVVKYDGDNADIAFAVSITLELMLGIMCLVWFVHAQVYRLPERRQRVLVKLLTDNSSDESSEPVKKLFIIMGDRVGMASYTRQARMKRIDDSDANAPPAWQILVGSFAFPIAPGEEGAIWERVRHAVSLLAR